MSIWPSSRPRLQPLPHSTRSTSLIWGSTPSRTDRRSLTVQQFPHRLREEALVLGVLRRVAGAVAPDGGDGAQFGVAQVAHLFAAVVDLEVEVGLAGHDEGACGDRTERDCQVAAVELVVGDVAVLPGPELGEQVVGVAAAEIALPAGDEEILEAVEAEAAPEFPAVEGREIGRASWRVCVGQ